MMWKLMEMEINMSAGSCVVRPVPGEASTDTQLNVGRALCDVK